MEGEQLIGGIALEDKIRARNGPRWELATELGVLVRPSRAPLAFMTPGDVNYSVRVLPTRPLHLE